MRIRSLEEMLLEYGIAELGRDDNDGRKEMLLMYPYSVIIEGGYMEFDTLCKWIEINISAAPINWIKIDNSFVSVNWLVYGKTDYDFGFAEYFFTDERQASAVAKAVPNIYTIYPHANPPNQTDKSNGYNEFIPYDPADQNAIVFTS